MSVSSEQVLKGDEAALADASPPKRASRRGDMAVGMLGMFMQMGTGLIMLPATAVFLSPSELTFWSVFLTIQTFNALLEFGFTPTFSRNFTYVFAGARTLSSEGVPDRTAGPCDLQVLRNLMGAAQNFYAKLAAVSLSLLATVGTLYLMKLSDHFPDVQMVWSSWVILVAAHAASTFLNWQNALLIGADRMRQFYIVIIASRLVQVVVSVVGLMLTQNLLVLAVGYALSIFAFRALTHYFIRDIVKSVDGVKAQPVEAKKITSIVAHNATKVGWVTLGAFMANRFNMLSISMFLGAVSAAQYAIAQQAFNALSTVSLVGVSMLLPMMANARVHNDKKLLRELLVFCNVSAWLIFACGLAVLMVSGDWLLSLIHSQTTLPPTLILLLLAGVFFLDLHIFISTQFITTGNRVPHLIATVATGFLIALGVFASGMAGGHLITFLVVQAVLMLAYNAWRWPIVAGREVDLTFSNFIPSAIAGAKRILIRHDREPVERNLTS